MEAQIIIIVTKATVIISKNCGLWYDIALVVTLLGTYLEFQKVFEKPITHALKKGVSVEEKTKGDEMANRLKEIINPFFLVGNNQNPPAVLRNKLEIVIWLPMIESQINYYKKFIDSPETKIPMFEDKKPHTLLELDVL